MCHTKQGYHKLIWGVVRGGISCAMTVPGIAVWFSRVAPCARASGARRVHRARSTDTRHASEGSAAGAARAAPGRPSIGRHAGRRRVKRYARARGRSTRSAGADYPHPSAPLVHAHAHAPPCSTSPSPAAQGDHARSVSPWFAHADNSRPGHSATETRMAWPTPSKKKFSPARRTADIALALFQDCAYPPHMTRRVGASDT